MFRGVHDGLLVGYSVDSESNELILSLAPHHSSADSRSKIVFSGTAGHYFDSTLLPAILSDIIPVTAEFLLGLHWPYIEECFKQTGWPGSWADSFAHAKDFAANSGIQGFQIESSYGLSGWVLAKSATQVIGS